MTKTIGLAHGNGGQENNELIRDVFYKAFKNDILDKSEDAAIIEGGSLAFSTDFLASFEKLYREEGFP